MIVTFDKHILFLSRPDHGPVWTVDSDWNRDKKTEFWIGFSVFELESVKIRFRFGPRNSESWTEPESEPDKKKFEIFLTEPDRIGTEPESAGSVNNFSNFFDR